MPTFIPISISIIYTEFFLPFLPMKDMSLFFINPKIKRSRHITATYIILVYIRKPTLDNNSLGIATKHISAIYSYKDRFI